MAVTAHAVQRSTVLVPLYQACSIWSYPPSVLGSCRECTWRSSSPHRSILSHGVYGWCRGRYPYAFANQGIILCIALTVAFGVGNVFTLRVLVRFTQVRNTAHMHDPRTACR